jgi:hypothetical protein
VNQNNSETFADKNGVSSDGGNQDENEQNPGQMHHCEQPEDTVTSVLLQQVDIKHNISFISGGLDPHSFTQGRNFFVFWEVLQNWSLNGLITYVDTSFNAIKM